MYFGSNRIAGAATKVARTQKSQHGAGLIVAKAAELVPQPALDQQVARGDCMVELQERGGDRSRFVDGVEPAHQRVRAGRVPVAERAPLRGRANRTPLKPQRPPDSHRRRAISSKRSASNSSPGCSGVT